MKHHTSSNRHEPHDEAALHTSHSPFRKGSAAKPSRNCHRRAPTQNPFLSYIRFQWQDYSGILRGRVVPIHRCLRLAKENKLVQVPPIAFECVLDNTLVPGLDPTGTDWLLPDWDSARTSRHSAVSENSYATVMCEVIRTTPARPIPDSDLCPRRALPSLCTRPWRFIK